MFSFDKYVVGKEFVSFFYSKDEIVFEERIFIKGDFEGCEFLLASLHMAIGVGYYKAHVEKEMRVPYKFSDEQLKFWRNFYEKGLGEFYYRNELKADFDFVITDGAAEVSEEGCLDAFADGVGCLVPLGGGKDSLVSVELLKGMGEEVTVFSVRNPEVIEKCAKASGLEHMVVGREMSANLFELNKSEGIYNGHVPITGIISFVALLAAKVAGKRYVVWSNESSANEPTVGDVNHQWSKSFEFEKAFAEYIGARERKDVVSFSLLRPISELQIVKMFAGRDCFEKYLKVFSSCNRNFAINKNAERMWCGECAKCAFVYGLFSVFWTIEKMDRVFECNMLVSYDYDSMLGLGDGKPWDCVGEILETRYVFSKLGLRRFDDDFKGLFGLNENRSEDIVPDRFLEELAKWI